MSDSGSRRVLRVFAAPALLGAVTAAVLTGPAAVAAAAEPSASPTSPGAGSPSAPPAIPLAPPVNLPGGAAANQCAPPATTVVRPVPWAQQRLAPELAWKQTTGRGVTVAVIDSGVDGSVPQLAGHVLPGIDLLRPGGRADTDCAGHGTFVAGVIAAQQKDGIGFAGIAPGVRILPIRQFDADVDGNADGLAAAIVAAVDRGATVINISTSAFVDTPVLRKAVDFALRKDVVVVAAVSNEAQEGNPKTFPAAYPGVIAVGAIGQNGDRGSFSETGEFVDLVAPGEQIISLGRGGPGHLQGDGTSFAAPFVAGVAALARAYHPKLTAAQIKKRLEATADHPGTKLPDPQFGFGVVNPAAAVASVLPDEDGPVAPAAAPKPVSPPAPVQRVVAGRGVALAVGAAAVLLAVVAGLAAIVVPRGRQRRWRPASQPKPPARQRVHMGGKQ